MDKTQHSRHTSAPTDPGGHVIASVDESCDRSERSVGALLNVDERVAAVVAAPEREHQAAEQESSPSASASTGTAATAWPPLLLPGPVDLPAFPLHALSSWHREYVETLGRWKNVAPDGPAMLSLAMIGAAAAKRTEVWVGSDERVPVNIWVMAVTPSGEGKSPISEELERPFAQVQRELIGARETRIRGTKIDREVAEQRYRVAIRECARAADDAERARLRDEAQNLDEELRKLAPEPKVSLYTEDTTPEALTQLLADNHGAIALLSDEGSSLFTNVMRRSVHGIDNIEALLKGHSGTTVTVNRLSRPSLLVPEPALCIAVATQTRTFAKLVRREAFLGRGLWERFLIVIPPSLVGRRKQGVRSFLYKLRETRGQYVVTIRSLLGLPVVEEGDGRLQLHVTVEGQKVFDDFCEALDRRMAPGGDLAGERMQAWGNKIRTNVLRLAAILFLSDYSVPIDRHVSEGVALDANFVERAIEIMTYCLAHARSVLENNELLPSDVEVALEWIRGSGRPSFRARELHRAKQSTFTRAAQLDVVIASLLKLGAVRAVPSRGTPGRPPDEFEVHPELLKGP